MGRKPKQPELIKETEFELRDKEAPWPKTEKELLVCINDLINREHDYGTAVNATSLAAVATFNYMVSKLGLSGFQASSADLDIIRRTRDLEHPFRIIDYGKLLYPQFANEDHFPSAEYLIQKNKKWAKKEAQKLIDIKDNEYIAERVMDWWKYLASMEIEEGDEED